MLWSSSSIAADEEVPPVRLQLNKPAEHTAVVQWPLDTPLAGWAIEGIQRVAGLHRHVVRMVEGRDTSYVVKELPDDLAEREWRLLRELADAGLPTAEVVGVVTGRADSADGLLITRHLDYSLPYRVLLSGRGLQIPYLGARMLDALAGLLVRLHLGGFFWGDCSLSNTLFRRDAGALSAYIIDVETGERHVALTDGQRALDLQIAIENLAGGLLDLQAGGLLAEGIDPMETALAIEATYGQLWSELTAVDEFNADETYRVDQRLRRLHALGFEATELELYSTGGGDRLRLVPCVVEHGYHAQRLQSLTGLDAAAARLVKDLLHARVADGATVILTTHILDVAERLADRIGIIRAGRLVAEGTLAELRRQAGQHHSTLEELFLELVRAPAEAPAA